MVYFSPIQGMCLKFLCKARFKKSSPHFFYAAAPRQNSETNQRLDMSFNILVTLQPILILMKKTEFKLVFKP
jgi:hypothetical protein